MEFVYNDRQMKDFLKILIHSFSLDIGLVAFENSLILLKKKWNWIRLDGTNKIEYQLPFVIELINQFSIGHILNSIIFVKNFAIFDFIFYYDN